ncbi:MAG TPA: hypothetical protein VMS76_11860 [Planctomycetota bacterium]|nr:hypothetical protein [Planctomycetota bacterium]
MQSREQMEAYRRMTPEERWRITVQLMEFAWRSLMALDHGERGRRLEVARWQHRLSNEAIAARLK